MRGDGSLTFLLDYQAGTARMLRASSFYTKWQEMMGDYSWDTIIPEYGNRALTKVDQLQNAKMPVGGWSMSKPSEG